MADGWQQVERTPVLKAFQSSCRMRVVSPSSTMTHRAQDSDSRSPMTAHAVPQ